MAEISIRPVQGTRNDSIRNDFFVYVHTRNDTGEVFYVGKGRGRRLKTKRHHNQHWMRVAEKHGFTVHLKHSGLSETCAFTLEKILIARHRKLGSPLVNMTDGGEGVSGAVFSEEAREKMRLAKVGKKLSADHVQKIAASNTGKKRTEEQKSWFKTRVFTDSYRKAISEGLKGRKLSPASIAKMKETRKGYRATEETKRKQSEALSGPKNPHFSPVKYEFVHPDHGVRICTQYELRTEFGLPHSNLSRLTSGERNVVHGWRLLKPGG